MRRVVVVGAGIVGLCAADALLRRGCQVTVIERDSAPGGGCSYGNGGLVVPSHFEPLAAPGVVMAGLRMLRSRESPFGISGLTSPAVASWLVRFARAGTRAHVERCAPVLRDLNLASRALYEGRYGSMAVGYQRSGLLMVCQTDAGFDAERRLAHDAERLGLKARTLDRESLQAFETGVEVDAVGAVYLEDDARLSPRLFMPALRKRVLDTGGCILEGVGVSGFKRNKDLVEAVIHSAGEVPADEVVLAAGAWSGALAQSLGLRLPLLAGKGYGFTVHEPPATPRYPAIFTEARVAVTPMPDGVRFVGTMELGLPSQPIANEPRLKGMRRSIREVYPAYRSVDLDSIPAWAGLRPCSPDGMPYIGRTARVENLVVATGHGMMGMSLGPITGELVAQLVNREPSPFPLDALAPDRYA